jgi:hypothetical protein
MTVRQNEFLVGAIFLAMGVAGLFLSLQYRFFAGPQVGPGAFPAMLAGIMILLGIVQTATAYRLRDASPAHRFHWRPIFFVCLAVALFAVLIDRVGALAALAAAAAVVGFAGGTPSPKHIVAVYLVVAAFLYFVVLKLIGIQLPLFWW